MLANRERERGKEIEREKQKERREGRENLTHEGGLHSHLVDYSCTKKCLELRSSEKKHTYERLPFLNIENVKAKKS